MHTDVAWVYPWLIALKGEHIRSILVWRYRCYYKRDNFMHIRSILVWRYRCYYIRDDFM